MLEGSKEMMFVFTLSHSELVQSANIIATLFNIFIGALSPGCSVPVGRCRGSLTTNGAQGNFLVTARPKTIVLLLRWPKLLRRSGKTLVD